MRKITHIGIVVCMVLAMSGADAQEYIKSVGFSPNSNSLIRSVSSTSWVYHAYSNHLSSFSLMNSTGSTHSAISQLPFWVSDMAVRNNNVFFCGTKYYQLFGYFSLNGFPNTTVNTVTVPGLKPVDNIEVFYYGGNVRHVVLTGSYGGNCIIDAMQSYPFTGAWDLTIATNTNVDIVYHDVAVTDNHVVASGVVSYGNSGYIVSFEKQQMHIGGFLQDPGKYIKTADSVYGNILLKAGIGDTLYAVYSSSASGDRFTVEEYKAVGSNITRIAGRRYVFPYSTKVFSASIEDITFKSANNSIDVLMWWNTASSSNSIVWKTSHSQLVSGGSIIGRNYEGHRIQSIDDKPSSPWNIFASGYEISSGSMRFYQIYATSQGVCSTGYTSQSLSLDDVSKHSFSVSTTSTTIYPDEESKEITTINSSTICTSNKTESDE